MKTLIIVTHPKLEKSVVNKRWIEELEKYPEKYIIHDLHHIYPDEEIDVDKEQRLLESVNQIVFQFPFYWFNCPPLLKKYIDDVLTHGWAYGSNSGFKLSGKKIALAISAGIKDEDYQTSGRYKYTLEQLTSPFEITFLYVRADYQPFYAFYGAEHSPDDEEVTLSAKGYINFLENLEIESNSQLITSTNN
ncbi:MAG: NAD(P)H-dependent oxidoreductase [Cyclobacteriaceae bacterium]